MYSELNHYSGIVALVFVGIFMKAGADNSQYPKVTNSVNGIIDYLGWVMETCVFLVAGVYIGKAWVSGYYSLT